jgi:hypothetical protein
MPPMIKSTPMVRPIPMPIDAPLEIPECTAEEEGLGEEVADIMGVVGVKIGGTILEFVIAVILELAVGVMPLGKGSMSVSVYNLSETRTK